LFGKNIKNHKASYLYYYGLIPTGLYILHKCDNKLCVNPTHLYAGTRQDNANDAKKFGTFKGIKNGRSILTDEIIIKIINDTYNHKYTSCNQIAKIYNVTAQNIRLIFRRKIWTHITEKIDNDILQNLQQNLNMKIY